MKYKPKEVVIILKLKGKIVEKFGTVTEFARAMGVTQPMCSQWLHGKVRWSENRIKQAMGLLGIHERDRKKYFGK